MENNVTIDRQTLKALVVESRLDILKLLVEKSYTLSDIAELLNLKKSTVSEHLKVLESADLIKKEETKRKWKYYSLTFKGRKLVQPKEVAVMFAFAINAIALLGAIGFYIRQMVSSTAVVAQDSVMEVRSMVADAGPESAMMAAETTTAAASGSPSIFALLLVLVLTASAGFLLGYLFKKSIFVIGRVK